MKMTAMILSLAMISSTSFGGPKCQGLREELQALQQAQAQIMRSLVSNHESFAVVMEEYSLASTNAPAVTFRELKKSAQAFRERGLQGKRIADKLNQSTEELITRVNSCLPRD